MQKIEKIHSGAKRSANLSIRSELLQQAKELAINLSRTLEESLEIKIRFAKREQWLQENKAAIEDYNDRIEKNGVFSEGLRRF